MATVQTTATVGAQDRKWSASDWLHLIQLILWKALILLVLGVLYFALVSEGMRYVNAALGQKLHKLAIPGFSYLGLEVSLRKLDLAHCFAIMLMIATYKL